MAIDMSAAKAPPARSKRAPASSKAPVGPPPALVVAEKSPLNQERFEGMMGIAQLGQGVCLMMGLHADAMTIGKFFPPVAKELANIADENESVAKPLDFLIKVGPYGALIAAAMPLVMQLAVNHKMADPLAMQGFGVVAPEVLEAQMKAEMMRMQAQAMQAQQAAVNAANEAAAEYAKAMSSAEASP